MVNKTRFTQRLEAMTRLLTQLDGQARFLLQHVSYNILPGEFRSPFRFPTGLERDVPRALTLDDDPGLIDMHTIPPSLAAHSLAEAILREDMRLIQSVHHSESKFLLIVDLSRSMLSGCFTGNDPAQLSVPAQSKLQGLYQAVSVYLRIAEATGFVLRAIYLHERVPEEQPFLGPRNFAQQAMFVIKVRLLKTYRFAEESPGSREPFLMKGGLNLALTYRNRGVVIVVSDFLDPLSQYRAVLAQVMARHRVVLVDVASQRDRDFPVPDWRDAETRRIPFRDGARHAEEGTEPMILTRNEIKAWNEERQADRDRLEALARQFNADLVSCRNESYRQCYSKAIQVFSK